MTAFEDMLRQDAINVFTGATDFGEAIVYRPVNGPIRSIMAQVIRNPPKPIGAPADWVAPKMLIMVANDSTKGISSAELDTGGDSVDVAYRVGGPVENFRLRNSDTPDDVGMLTLELR